LWLRRKLDLGADVHENRGESLSGSQLKVSPPSRFRFQQFWWVSLRLALGKVFNAEKKLATNATLET